MPQRTDRIKSLASRVRFRVGPFLVHPDRLAMLAGDREIALEPRTMEVLAALAENAGEVLSAEQLLIDVWGGTFYGDNPVHKAIAHLRRLMGDDSRAPRYIETIRKRGYRLIADVAFPDSYRQRGLQDRTWNDGSPYMGLAAFDSRHASVFFGRSRATAELLAALRSQIERERRFVLMVGASGCGKTSLLRAGAVPLLLQEGGFDGLEALSVAHCDFGGCSGGDVLSRVAESLLAWSLGDRPVFGAVDGIGLSELMRTRTEYFGEAVKEAFVRHPFRTRGDRPHSHLLLTIDHAESLVAAPGIDDGERNAFALVLQRLCETPRVMVVMVARSDFYPRLVQALPLVADYKAGDGHVDVLAPRAGEIAQIIRAPAALAGLAFEQDADTTARLDDILRDTATGQPDALPLLQHTLEALYERRSEGSELRFSAYRDIGGLEGALAHRAEQVFSTLPPEASACLDMVFAQLIVVQTDSSAVSARFVQRSALEKDGAKRLVEAFIHARLFVGELHDGHPVFGVAHEALLRNWPRAVEWVQDNRRLLLARSRLRRAASQWREDGQRSDHLLNPGRPLVEAREAALRMNDLDADERAFLLASEGLLRRRRWFLRGAAFTLAALTAASGTFGFMAHRARLEAEHHRGEALQLMDFMLVEVADKLRPLGNLKLLSSLGGKALSLLEPRSQASMGQEELINHSRALRTVGEVMMEQGRSAEAGIAFARADRASRMAAGRAAASAGAIEESGQSAYWLGYHHYRQGRLEDARRYWTVYLRASERLLRITPDRGRALAELSYALNNLGTLARDQGRHDRAIGYFERSAKLKRHALAYDPDNSELQYDLIDTLSWISSGHESQGRLVEAASGYAEQIAMLRALLARAPENHAWERRLANSLTRSAHLATDRGLLDNAWRDIGESVVRLSGLVKREPDNRIWQRNLAYAQAEAGDIARLRGDRASAIEHFDSAHKLSRQLQPYDNGTPAWQRLDANIRLMRASAHGDARATADMESAINDLRIIAARSPSDMQAIFALGRALVARGEHHMRLGAQSLAHRDWSDACAVMESLARDSKDTAVLATWARAHLLAGNPIRSDSRLMLLKISGYRHPDMLAAEDLSARLTAKTNDKKIISMDKTP